MSTPTFQYFLEQFPDLELPLTFSEDTVRTISRETPPLPPALIAEFLLPIEPGMADELTEFVACMRLPQNKDYVGIVYWMRMENTTTKPAPVPHVGFRFRLPERSWSFKTIFAPARLRPRAFGGCA